MSWITFFTPIIVLVIVMHLIDARDKARKDRNRLLEQALKRDDLDAESRQAILEGIRGGSRMHAGVGHAGSRGGWFGRFCLFVGWITLFVGIAFGVLTVVAHFPALEIPAAVLVFSGLGFVTYPFAAADLAYRRALADQAGQNAGRKSAS